MSELIKTLGVNWKLLLAQAVNFLIILTVLRFTVYKPLTQALRKRREKIEQGLRDAESAGTRLAGIEKLEQERLAIAEEEAMGVLSEAENRAKNKEAALLEVARGKEKEVLLNAERVAAAKKAEAEEKVYAEATALIREGIRKTVQGAPAAIDEALIAEAVKELRKAKS